MRGRTYLLLTMCVAVIVAAIAVTVHSVTSRTVSAWVMTADAQAGTALGPANMHQITIHQGTDDFAVLTASPTGKILAHAVRHDDVLRPDDVLDGTMVTVPITFKTAAPGLQSGDTVDIYGPSSASVAASGADATSGGSANQLYGRGITVVAVTPSAAIMVPAMLEGYWVTLSTSGVPLTAVLSKGIAVPPGRRYSLSDAEQVLAGVADSAAGASTDSGPTASPTGGG